MPLANALAWFTAFGLVVAAATDLRWRLIPNVLVGALLILGLLALIVAPAGLDPIGALLGGLVVLVAGAVLFAAGAMGGGDVKLLAVTSLWAAPDRLLELLVVMTMLGGALGLVLLAARCARALPGLRSLPAATTPTVPYGVAIAGAGLWVLAPRL